MSNLRPLPEAHHLMFEQHLQKLQDHHLLRRLRTIDSATGPTAVLEGREVILLSSNNYLGLATHPTVVEAAIAAGLDCE